MFLFVEKKGFSGLYRNLIKIASIEKINNSLKNILK